MQKCAKARGNQLFSFLKWVTLGLLPQSIARNFIEAPKMIGALSPHRLLVLAIALGPLVFTQFFAAAFERLNHRPCSGKYEMKNELGGRYRSSPNRIFLIPDDVRTFGKDYSFPGFHSQAFVQFEYYTEYIPEFKETISKVRYHLTLTNLDHQQRSLQMAVFDGNPDASPDGPVAAFTLDVPAQKSDDNCVEDMAYTTEWPHVLTLQVF